MHWAAFRGDLSAIEGLHKAGAAIVRILAICNNLPGPVS